MFEGHYDEWRQSRMNGIRKYVDMTRMKGKTLLELGCGHADNGDTFARSGCEVTCSDARDEHLRVAKEKHPDLNYVLFDADTDKLQTKYDIILHWGLLYHLNMSNIASHIHDVCEHADYLFLETEVSDSSDASFVIRTNEEGYDQAFNAFGNRPSEFHIEALLEEEGFRFEKIVDPILNANMHRYDWCLTNARTWHHGLRRFWICWSGNVESPLVRT
jgi:hypothetical protein